MLRAVKSGTCGWKGQILRALGIFIFFFYQLMLFEVWRISSDFVVSSWKCTWTEMKIGVFFSSSKAKTFLFIYKYDIWIIKSILDILQLEIYGNNNNKFSWKTSNVLSNNSSNLKMATWLLFLIRLKCFNPSMTGCFSVICCTRNSPKIKMLLVL